MIKSNEISMKIITSNNKSNGKRNEKKKKTINVVI